MGFTQETLHRVKATALIMRADKADKMAEIAISITGQADTSIVCPVMTYYASMRYVVGCLKSAVRRGETRTMLEALDRLECAQVGDTGTPLVKPSAVSREVARINRTNGFAIPEKRVHRVGMAKVYGSLYVQWEASEQDSDMASAYVRDHVQETLKSYIAEYIARLSSTGVKAVKEICASSVTVKKIMLDAENKGLRNRVEYLHRGFPRRDSISAREFALLLRQYAQVA